MKNKLSPSQWGFLLVVFLLVFGNFNIARWDTAKVIDWDIVGYYAYLPATFIYHDYKLNFTRNNPQLAEEHKFWPHPTPNGGLVIKPTMGLAILYAPFFFMAHLQSQIQGLPADGFSYYYHMWIHFSALFYLIIGLFTLRKLLRMWFGEWTVAITLMSIAIGTNLYYFATSESSMSHAYTFSISTVFMYAVVRWYQHPRWGHLIIAGLCLGMLTLIRPVNLLFAMFPLLFGLNHLGQFKERFSFLLHHYRSVILFMVSSFIVLLPQMLYWKSITGQYVFYSYFDEHFFFLQPALIKGIFGFRNGWLIYTPIMGFAMVGLFLKNRTHHPALLALRFLMPIYLYVVLSWWCWWYIGFSNRAMIDAYAFLSIPFALCIEKIWKSADKIKRTFVSLIIVLVVFNQFQTMQYRKGLIHYDGMNIKAYMASFGRLKYTDAYKNALQSPDYEKAKNGME